MRADSKRDEIVRAAIRLFAQRGVDGTSVKEIATAAGVTDAALYKHFQSKDALALAVFTHYSDLYTRIIDEAASSPGTFRERLDSLVATIVRLVREDPYGLQLLGDRYRFSERPPPDHRVPSTAIAQFISTGVATGELPQQDPLLTGALLFGAMIRVTVWCDVGLLDLEGRLSELQARIRGLFGVG